LYFSGIAQSWNYRSDSHFLMYICKPFSHQLISQTSFVQVQRFVCFLHKTKYEF
jgi:hypothetical protein